MNPVYAMACIVILLVAMLLCVIAPLARECWGEQSGDVEEETRDW